MFKNKCEEKAKKKPVDDEKHTKARAFRTSAPAATTDDERGVMSTPLASSSDEDRDLGEPLLRHSLEEPSERRANVNLPPSVSFCDEVVVNFDERNLDEGLDTLDEGLDESFDSNQDSYQLVDYSLNDPNSKMFSSSFYITIPWSPQMYFTMRGAENLHIYIWIAKDLAWLCNGYEAAMFFGVVSMVWCCVLAFHAVSSRCITEVYMLIITILWLSANFLWMSGEVFHGDDDAVVYNTAYILESAMVMYVFYHAVLRPFGIIPKDDMSSLKYDDEDLVPPIPYFRNWREYEHFHTFCWLGKDLSWNKLNVYTYMICMVPTLLISIDFVYSTYRTKKMTIDCIHYVSMLIWVLACGVWAMGALVFIPFVPGYTDDWTTYPLFDPSHEGIRTCRWWASWVLMTAFIPLICLYVIWLPLTCTGKLSAAEIRENRNISRQSYSSFSVAVKRKSKEINRWVHNVEGEYLT